MFDESVQKTDPPSSTEAKGISESLADGGRRALIRRAAIGIPVILATVHGRKVWGQVQVQQAGSAHVSGVPSTTP